MGCYSRGSPHTLPSNESMITTASPHTAHHSVRTHIYKLRPRLHPKNMTTQEERENGSTNSNRFKPKVFCLFEISELASKVSPPKTASHSWRHARIDCIFARQRNKQAFEERRPHAASHHRRNTYIHLLQPYVLPLRSSTVTSANTTRKCIDDNLTRRR